MTRFCPPSFVRLVLGGALAVVLAGCAAQDEPSRDGEPQAKTAPPAGAGASEQAPPHGAAPPAVPRSGDTVTVVTESDDDSPPPQYDAPKGWTASESEGAGRVAFHVADGDREVDVTVMRVPGHVQKVLPNVNRWRRQVQLGEITQAELDKTLQTVPVGEKQGQYFEMVAPEGKNPRLAMLIVLLEHEEKTWMFRMIGDADLALREKERFQGFLKTFQLPAGDKGKNGD